MEYYSAIKQNEIMPLVAKWIDGDYHIKWGKPVGQILYHLESKNDNTDELIHKTNRITDIKNKHGYQGGEGAER